MKAQTPSIPQFFNERRLTISNREDSEDRSHNMSSIRSPPEQSSPVRNPQKVFRKLHIPTLELDDLVEESDITDETLPKYLRIDLP